MKNNIPEILIKGLFGAAELVFVGSLCVLRVLNIGWLLIIFGIGLVIWVLFHLVVMGAFITTFKVRPADVILYLFLHFFYLFAWLFQSDGGDTGPISWTVQKIYTNPVIDSFLMQYGDPIFWVMFALTLVCYLAIGILLGMRLFRVLKDRKKIVQAV